MRLGVGHPSGVNADARNARLALAALQNSPSCYWPCTTGPAAQIAEGTFSGGALGFGLIGLGASGFRVIMTTYFSGQGFLSGSGLGLILGILDGPPGDEPAFSLAGGLIGGLAGYATGFITTMPHDRVEAVSGAVSFGFTALADIAGNRSGYDPVTQELVVGADTRVSFAATTIGAVNPEVYSDFAINVADFYYAFDRADTGGQRITNLFGPIHEMRIRIGGNGLGVRFTPEQ